MCDSSIILQDGLVSGQPLWALVFYCMRCGDMEDAMKVLTDSKYALHIITCN